MFYNPAPSSPWQALNPPHFHTLSSASRSSALIVRSPSGFQAASNNSTGSKPTYWLAELQQDEVQLIEQALKLAKERKADAAALPLVLRLAALRKVLVSTLAGPWQIRLAMPSTTLASR